MLARSLFVVFWLCLGELVAPPWTRADEERTKVGPAGHDRGKEFTDRPIPKGAPVVGVRIRHGRYIDGIELLYKTADGKEEGLGWHGGPGGEAETFLLEDGEFINGITGKTGEYVESLVVVTNKRKSKMFGGDGGDKTFDLQKAGEVVTGFFGRSGAFLDQVGIFVHKSPEHAGQDAGAPARKPVARPAQHAPPSHLVVDLGHFGSQMQIVRQPNGAGGIRWVRVDLGYNVKMEFVRIPAGEFLMGSPDSDNDANAYEKPQHRAKITKDFYLGRFPVTQEQYTAVMDNNPSRFRFGGGGIGPGVDTRHLPVETITWDGASEYCAELTRRDKQGRVFCLPTEAEWEYAARAGTTTRYYFGDQPAELRRYGWYRENSGHKPQVVGSLKPNAWGLYDMNGNVWQWCADRFGQFYAAAGQEDPQGPDGGSSHVIRGGSFSDAPLACRVAYRHGSAHAGRFEGDQRLEDQPAYRAQNIGFRVAVRAQPQNTGKAAR